MTSVLLSNTMFTLKLRQYTGGSLATVFKLAKEPISAVLFLKSVMIDCTMLIKINNNDSNNTIDNTSVKCCEFSPRDVTAEGNTDIKIINKWHFIRQLTI